MKFTIFVIPIFDFATLLDFGVVHTVSVFSFYYIITFKFFQIAVAWKSVHSVELLYDAGIGMLIFIPIAFLSWFPFVSTFQTQPKGWK